MFDAAETMIYTFDADHRAADTAYGV